MSVNSYRSSVLNESLLNAEALRLSENGAFDDLELLFDDCFNPDEPLFQFADSRSSAGDLDAFLRESRGSDAMEFELEALEALKYSINSMKLDVVHAGGDPAMPVNMSDLTTSAGSGGRPAPRGHIIRERSTIPQKVSQQRRFQLKTVEFDPPSEREQPQQQGHDDQPPVPSSCDQPPASSSSEASRGDQPPAPSSSEAQYSDALQKLAESMKRTGESRRHVMMQRQMLTPAQLRALSLAMERLNHHPGPQQQPHVVASPALHANASMSISPRSSVVAAFLSGSRGTLTNGLEQSRKQLRAYMESVNHQTL